MAIKIRVSDLEAAAKAGRLTPEQVGPVWEYLEEKSAANPGISLSLVLSYLGIAIAIMGFGWYGLKNFEIFTAIEYFWMVTALAYLSLFGAHYSYRSGSEIQAGMLATFAVVLTPVAILCLQIHFNYWPFAGGGYDRALRNIRDFHTIIDGRWLTLELSTLAMAVLMLVLYRAPYIMMPMMIVFFWMVMDITYYQEEMTRLAAKAGDNYYERTRKLYEWNSVYFGAAALAASFAIDYFRTSKKDYAYWICIAGTISFWGGLVAMGESGDLAAFKFAMVNVVLLIAGAVRERGILLVAGSLGLLMYFYRLVEKQFGHEPLFPIYAGMSGLVLLMLVIAGRKHYPIVMRTYRASLPASWIRTAR